MTAALDDGPLVCPQCDSDQLEYQGECGQLCLCDEYRCLDCGHELTVEFPREQPR